MATVFPPAEDTKNVVLGNVNDGPTPSSLTQPTEKNANPNAGVAGGEANALMTTKPVHHDAFPSQEKAVPLAGKGNPLVACPSVGIAEAIKVSSKPYDSERNRFRHDECPELEEESVEDTYSILIQTLFIVCCIIAAKICMRRFIPWKGETDLSEISLVFTGLFFIMGQMFSNVNADLKEAEKMPMDLVSSLDQMEDGFVLCSAKIPEKVNLLDAQFLIAEFARTWRDTLLKENNKSFGDCLNLLADIVDLTREWDKKGAANTVNILNTVDKVRRTVARATVIKRTDVLPSARALLNFFIFMSCSLLFLASYKTEVGLSVVMACVMTVCIFMGRIIHSMDDPFNIKPKSRVMKWVKGHMASIQLFPVLEYIQRMERRMERQLEGMRVLQMQQAGIMQPALKPT